MSALTLTLTAKLTHQLDCSGLTPDKLAGLSLKQIGNLPLAGGKVSDFFTLSGQDSQQIIFKKSTAQLDHIGRGMKSGHITIEGDAGDYLGASMRNGRIICKGNAGARVADQMRRGLILIDGNAGDYCASRMIAGTVGVYGKLGAYAGYSLRRGTLLLTQTPTTQATWLDCGTHTLPFLRLLFASFKPLNSKFAKIKQPRVHRWMGDVSQNGKGEILLLSTKNN